MIEPDYRFTLANERTFLAWQRTSLGLLAAAVAVLHFLPDTAHPVVTYGLGAVLGAAAILASTGGLMRWRESDRAIRQGRPLPASHLTTVLAVLLAVIGLVVVVAGAVTAV